MSRFVFGVRPDYRAAVRDWVRDQGVPTVVRRDVFAPTVTGWAVLDAGITAIEQYGMDSLSTGIRVLGWQTFRLLIAEFGLVGPRQFAGETVIEPAELLRRQHSAAANDEAAQARAALLAECDTGARLRGVVEELLNDREQARATVRVQRHNTADWLTNFKQDVSGG